MVVIFLFLLVIFFIILINIEFSIFGTILLIFIFGSIYWLINAFDNYIIESNRKSEEHEMLLMSEREKKRDEQTQLEIRFSSELKSFLNNEISTIASAYRKTVTTNSFGKRSYGKFIPELIEYIEDHSNLNDIQNELENKYDCSIPITITDEIIRMLEDSIKKLDEEMEYSDTIEPLKYEHYCAAQFSKFGWKAKVTQGSSDQGVDVIVSKNGFTIVAQCKKYKKQVGNKAVQEIVAGVKHYRARKGIVIAPNGFTNSAIRLAESNNIDLIHHSEIKYY